MNNFNLLCAFFLVLFSCELGGECWPNIEDSTWQPVSHDEKELSQSNASASQRKQHNSHLETELLECSAHKSGEMSQGELVLVLAPKQMQASLIHSSSLILRDGPLVSDLTDNHTVQGESSHWSEPDEARLSPFSMQSNDCLPTFTNQRPPYVASRNTSSSNTTKQRYRK